jgi:hypothetical protein
VSAVAIGINILVVLGNGHPPLGTTLELDVVDFDTGVDDVDIYAFSAMFIVDVLQAKGASACNLRDAASNSGVARERCNPFSSAVRLTSEKWPGSSILRCEMRAKPCVYQKGSGVG